MRVGNGGIESSASGGVGSVGGAGAETGSAAAATNAKSDSVTLASAASLVALAKATAALRQSRVDSLGSQVKSGSYQADNVQVSHAVVQDHITS